MKTLFRIITFPIWATIFSVGATVVWVIEDEMTWLDCWRGIVP